MKTKNPPSLKNTYSDLKDKMWQISTQSYQLDKQNDILKSKIINHRSNNINPNNKSKNNKSKSKTIKSYTQFHQPSDNQEPNHQAHMQNQYEKECARNMKLKAKLWQIDQQKRQIERCILITNTLQKKNQTLQTILKKQTRKLKKIDNKHPNLLEGSLSLSNSPSPFSKLSQKQSQISTNISHTQTQENQLINYMNELKQILQEQIKINKQLGVQTLALLSNKANAKQYLKFAQKQNNGNNF